mmetsp:Transcript_2672/g.5649  ORF Transcript_2672/g.5649 Transcript_2672/m.5649 type:complete len:124 (-) Transcript_2672:49-420(-)
MGAFPRSHWHSAEKFSTALGATSPNKPKIIRPTDSSSTKISRNTRSVTRGSVGMGSIFGGIAFFVGTSYSDLTKTTQRSCNSSSSIDRREFIVVFLHSYWCNVESPASQTQTAIALLIPILKK